MYVVIYVIYIYIYRVLMAEYTLSKNVWTTVVFSVYMHLKMPVL